jgi:hypothetical protein
MTRTPIRRFGRLLIAALTLSLLATACFGGGGDLGGVAAGLGTKKSKDVKPPKPIDSKATALAGLILQTNSPSMRRLADSPKGTGAVVLFVQPGGPSDNKSIGRGDLLTEIDGTKVGNHEHALALLRSRPGTKHKLSFSRKDGTQRTVEITARVPGKISTFSFINPEVQQNPRDPLLRFMRAQSESSGSAKMTDLQQALSVDSKFVEAITLLASLTWDQQNQKGLKKPQKIRLRNQALAGWTNALDLDPTNTTALSVRSTAWTELGNPKRGKKDADRARDADPSHPRAYYATALADMGLNKPDDAAGPALAAINLNPYNAVYYLQLERVFVKLKRKDDCSKTADAISPYLLAQGKQFQTDVGILKKICG